MIDDLLTNLTISDIAVHEIFKREANRRKIPPAYAQHLEELSPKAIDTFRARVTDALSAKAKAIEMDINDTGPGTFQDDAKTTIGLTTSSDFLSASRVFADKLAAAQKSQTIPGGCVVIFRGKTSTSNIPFIAVIKAEVQEGFRRYAVGGVRKTEFVDDLFMTKATRLYKIGFMTCSAGKEESPSAWKCIIYDHAITVKNREAAALYFYEGFLGCRFPEDSAYETARFFNLTKEFAQNNVDNLKTRHDLLDSLYTYVKNDQAPTFTTKEFTERYIPEDLKDKYGTFMIGKHFPDRAIKRDIDDLKNKLKRRRFQYDNNIELSVPPEVIANGLVTIDTLPQDGGEANAITHIKIRAPFLTEK